MIIIIDRFVIGSWKPSSSTGMLSCARDNVFSNDFSQFFLLFFFYFINRSRIKSCSARLYNIIIIHVLVSRVLNTTFIEQQFYGTQNHNKPSESFRVPKDSILYSRLIQTSLLGYFSNFSFLSCFYFSYLLLTNTLFSIWINKQRVRNR